MRIIRTSDGRKIDASGECRSALIGLSETELVLLANSIMESLGYGEEFEFQTFARSHVEAAEALHRRIRLVVHGEMDGYIASQERNPVHNSSGKVDFISETTSSDVHVFEVGLNDVGMLRHCIIDSLRGIEHWEYQIRLGLTPEEATELELQLSRVFRS